MFNIFRKKSSPEEDTADALYRLSVAQARQPVFYETHGVADTPDGRFDMIMLHVYLLLRRFRDDTPYAQAVGQALFDRMFVDMDQNLREMGAGDIGVAHRIKDMAKAFYGRIAAYDEGLDGGEDQLLADALRRNLYRKTSPADSQVAAVVSYMRDQVERLKNKTTDDIMSATVVFADDEG